MKLTKRELELVGASLYWGEGTKLRVLDDGRFIYSIEFTNNDPKMISIFLVFLRRIIGAVEGRIKGQLFVYTDQDVEKIADYWSSVTNIPRVRFQKIIVLKQRSGRFNPSRYGTFKVRYPHKEHFLKLQGIMDKLKGGV